MMTPEGMLRGAPTAGVEDKDLVTRDLAISVDTVMADGTRRSGLFVYMVPTATDETEIAAIAAQLRRGQPRGAFDADEAVLMDALAHLAVTLKRRPEWATKVALGDVLDVPDIFAMYREARAHQNRFQNARRDLRPGPADGHGAGGGDPIGVGGPVRRPQPG